jgi:arylsulfatase A-like enzyme
VSERPKSLVLITVDCLRADQCGFYGYTCPTTPFLNTIAAESFVVPKAVVAGAPTYYSIPALHASRMPLALGRDVIGLAPGEPTLAGALREAGYATAAFSAANPYISARFGYDQGFDVFEDFLDFDVTPPAIAPGNAGMHSSRDRVSTRGKINRSLRRAMRAVGLGSLYDELYFQYCLRLAAPEVENVDALRRFPAAEVIAQRVISWIESIQNKPFFLWLHLMDPHSPYYPSASAYRELTGKEISARRARYLNEFWNRSDLGPVRLQQKKDFVVELYDAGIRSADNGIANLVSHLRRMNMWDECALVLTADHGEEFLDHGRRYHAPVSLYDEIAHVPLMIRVPGVARKEVGQWAFSHLHLAPTLLDALGLPAPPGFQGKSVWSNLVDGRPWEEPSVTECVYGCTNPIHAKDRMAPRLLSVREGRHKLVMRLKPGVCEELYDLEADPDERQALPEGAENQVRGRLLCAARVHMQRASEAGRATLRLKARLRDLQLELQAKSR